MEKYVSIGFTKKTKGVRGDLKIQIDELYLDDLKKSGVVFLIIKGKEMPFFVEKIKNENELLLKLEDIDSKEKAYDLISKEMFLRASDVSVTIEEVAATSDLVFGYLDGFNLEDETKGQISKIEEVVAFPQQEMAIVIFNKKEILIPLHQDLIVEIDKASRVVRMDLPEGLLEL